jgi:2-polyprenyl-6-methoxyphenol hydroxylase-like FAD-dependent oxidoreductase
MAALKPITIVGGGLAGLTLGLALRQRGVPVTVMEAGRYPRHRVCGEFISGRGVAALERLDLLDRLRPAGGRPAETVVFYTEASASPVKRLPESAICLSRYLLDELLAREFAKRGGLLREGERGTEGEFGEGVVRGTGRRAQAREAGWRWLGLKAHVRHVELAADLEMHLVRDGYVGLCQLAGGVVNICGLFRSRAAWPESPHWRAEFLGGVAGSPLQQRLAGAEIDPASVCAVAGLSLRPVAAGQRAEFCVGDAITMIPPVTGNGMSMAFESAFLAAPVLYDFSAGACSWQEARERFSAQCEAVFERRLRWAGWLQWALLNRWARGGVVAAGRREKLWGAVFRLTR